LAALDPVALPVADDESSRGTLVAAKAQRGQRAAAAKARCSQAT